MDGSRIGKLEGNKVKLIFAIAAVAMVLTLAPAALAQDSVVNGYNNGGGGAQGQAEKGGNAAGTAADPADPGATQAGTLPFTGLDVGLVAGGGLLLIVAGAGMVWLTRPRTT